MTHSAMPQPLLMPDSILLEQPVAVPSAMIAAETITCQTVSHDVWEQLVVDFDGISQEQTHTFNRIRFPSLSLEPIVFTRGQEVVGGSLIGVYRLPLGIGSVAISKWGPMLRDATHPDRSALYTGMVKALVREYADKRGLMLSVLPRASLDDEQWSALAALGFKTGAGVPYPDRYLVNLTLSDDEQRASFEQKWRYHLKRSEKAGLTFEHSDDLVGFTDLYQAMCSRKRFPDFSAFETMPELMRTLPSGLRPEIFFVRHQGERIAGAVIFKAGDTAAYLYGATKDQALDLRAGYFMQWSVIRWLKANTAARWYDLGGTDGFFGLHQFKKGMIGTAGAVVRLPPMANYAASRPAFMIGTCAYQIREFARKLQYRLTLPFGNLARPDQTPQPRSNQRDHTND